VARPATGGFTAGPQVFGRTLLPSGVRVVTEELAGRPTVSLGVWVGSGSRVERAGLEGGAHFIEHLLFKGTKKRTAAALAKEIDAIGGHLDAFTSREYTAFYLNLLFDHLERGWTSSPTSCCTRRSPPTRWSASAA